MDGRKDGWMDRGIERESSGPLRDRGLSPAVQWKHQAPSSDLAAQEDRQRGSTTQSESRKSSGTKIRQSFSDRLAKAELTRQASLTVCAPPMVTGPVHRVSLVAVCVCHQEFHLVENKNLILTESLK